MALERSLSYNKSSALPVLTLFAHVVAIALITLLLVWLLHFREGDAFKADVEAEIFNLHPLLMVIGFVLLSGEAILAYMTVPAIRKWPRLIHLVVHLVALGAGIVGIYAVFKFHSDKGIAHMYSFHSWLGMSTICINGLEIFMDNTLQVLKNLKFMCVSVAILFLLVRLSSSTRIDKEKASTMARSIRHHHLLHGHFKRRNWDGREILLLGFTPKSRSTCS
ncbi:probable ascorbate-specific transmembrane electron transporter 1 [Primulina huaijiensis]|uniref:probable ascorbate-specific transmembrane electron transporter 1 n=1 Tax=Primulina huaijiensis TaxID=1492673 RepID=UPI003CC76413